MMPMAIKLVIKMIELFFASKVARESIKIEAEANPVCYGEK